MISSLTISLGLFYLLMAVIAAATLRTAAAPLAVKIIVPALLVVLTWVTYFTLPEMFGFPVETAFASLPQKAELVAFVPHDENKKVDLWLTLEGAPQPRAYSVELTDALKNTLRQAKKAQGTGERTMLAKGGKPGPKRPHQYSDIDGGNSPYELLPEAFNLPSKEAVQ